MSNTLLEAQSRADMGKGASRRLRRLENKVPGVIYGGDKPAKSILFLHNKVIKALESERIYSSVFDVSVDGKLEHVILKALQRHPYKPLVMHIDLQRVSAKDVLVKLVPIHFINQEQSKGVKEGGIINHTLNQIEVRCQAKDLPEFIEVDMLQVGMDDIIHLADLKLPKNVHLTVDVTDGAHNAPVVSIHAPKVNLQEEAEDQAAAEAAAAAAAAEVPADDVPTSVQSNDKEGKSE